MTDTVLMQFAWLENEPFSLNAIETNAGKWRGDFNGNPIFVPKEYELVIRQDGATVRVISRLRESLEWPSFSERMWAAVAAVVGR